MFIHVATRVCNSLCLYVFVHLCVCTFLYEFTQLFIHVYICLVNRCCDASVYLFKYRLSIHGYECLTLFVLFRWLSVDLFFIHMLVFCHTCIDLCDCILSIYIYICVYSYKVFVYVLKCLSFRVYICVRTYICI